MSININQTIMAVVGIAAIIVLIWRHRPGSTAPAAYSDLPENESAASEVAFDANAADAVADELGTAQDEPVIQDSAAKSSVKRRSAPKKAG
jgi:hypothetical protein